MWIFTIFFLYSKDRRNFKVGLILYIITLPFKYYMSHFKTCNERNLFKSICTWNERPMHFLTVKWNRESRSYAVTFGFKAELQITSLFFLLHRNGATGTREAVLTWPTFPLILLRLMRSILTTVPPI